MIDKQIRRVQAYTGERSLTIVLPKHFSEVLSIAKGDYVKCTISEKKLIVEKADV